MSYQEVTKSFQTILDFLRFGFSQARANNLHFGHGSDNAWDDICALVLETLNLPHDVNQALFQARLTDEEINRLSQSLYKRIIERIPGAYLTNVAYLCGLSFYVDNRVLIPRSPIAELILNNFEPWIEYDRVHNILDMCTGSGCIAISCCYAFPDAAVDATDISKDALQVAKINQERHGLHQQLNLIQSDCFDEVPGKQYDIIVSNPPYVDESEKATLPKEYSHEPELGLFAQNKGLAIVENILKNAKNYLSDHGILIVEVGNLEDAVKDAFPDVAFVWLEFENGGQGVFLLTKNELENL